MSKVRLGTSWAVAAALITVGVAAFVATRAAWVPCANGQFGDACLAAMDAPSHLPTLSMLWLIALALAVVAVIALRTRAARGLGVIAAGLVLVMNVGVEYMLFLAIAGGHWDSPSGTGYGMVTAFTLAGVLVGAGAILNTRHGQPSPAKPTQNSTIPDGAHVSA